MGYAIRLDNLNKNYGTNTVLKGISFTVNQGEVFALLGTNGAGKTTTLECIEGLRKYEQGTIEIHGKCGIQLQSSTLPQNIKAKEAIMMFAKWKRLKVTQEDLSRIGIQTFHNKQYAELSTGQKRRLHLALALLGNPDIVFLDEPTAGLDVEGRSEIHEEIKSLKEQGKTIILASHDMAEVEELCDRIAILKNGKIAFLGTAFELTETAQTLYQLKVRFSKEPIIDKINSIYDIQKENEYYIFQTSNLEDILMAIVGLCKEQNIVMRDVTVERAGIEQRFLEIAKEG